MKVSLVDKVKDISRPMRSYFLNIKDLIFDNIHFSLWIFLKFLHFRKRYILIRRMDALGDVVCTLPMCKEIRKLHPKRLIMFLTTKYCEDIVLLSRDVDHVYSARSVRFHIPSQFFGLVEKIYNPQTTDERRSGERKLHLIDDLAKSCNLTIRERQPRLFPSSELIKNTQGAYGLNLKVCKGEPIIGINCGPTWTVREWPFEKWQKLINKIHAEYDVHIIQFGTHISGKRNVYDELTGVQNLASRLRTEEIVALIASCELVVSIDSAPVHIAGAVKTPVIGLFGAVDPALRLPPDSISLGLHSEVPCLYCHHRSPIRHWRTGCPNNIRCMRELEVEPVFQAIKRLFP